MWLHIDRYRYRYSGHESISLAVQERGTVIDFDVDRYGYTQINIDIDIDRYTYRYIDRYK